MVVLRVFDFSLAPQSNLYMNFVVVVITLESRLSDRWEQSWWPKKYQRCYPLVFQITNWNFHPNLSYWNIQSNLSYWNFYSNSTLPILLKKISFRNFTVSSSKSYFPPSPIDITYRKKSQNFFPITKPNVQKHKRMPWLYNPMYGKKLKTSLADREATHLRCFHVRILLHDARNNDGKPSACINSTVKFK